MKCERRSPKNKSKKPWMPRPGVLIPAHRIMKSKKVYDRKKEKDLLKEVCHEHPTTEERHL